MQLYFLLVGALGATVRRTNRHAELHSDTGQEHHLVRVETLAGSEASLEFALPSAPVPAAPRTSVFAAGTLLVATFNLFVHQGTGLYAAFRHALRAIESVSGRPPDVLLLQEVPAEKEMMELLHEFRYVVDPTYLWQGNAEDASTPMYTAVRSPDFGGQWAATTTGFVEAQDSLCPTTRAVSVTQLEHRPPLRLGVAEDRPASVSVANVHLCGGGLDEMELANATTATREQAKIGILKSALQVKPDLVAGDFNSDYLHFRGQPVRAQVEYLVKQGWDPAAIEAWNGGPFALLEDSGFACAEAGGRKASAFYGARPDTVWATQALGLVRSGLVPMFDTRHAEARDSPSDHHMLVAEYAVPEPEAAAPRRPRATQPITLSPEVVEGRATFATSRCAHLLNVAVRDASVALGAGAFDLPGAWPTLGDLRGRDARGQPAVAPEFFLHGSKGDPRAWASAGGYEEWLARDARVRGFLRNPPHNTVAGNAELPLLWTEALYSSTPVWPGYYATKSNEDVEEGVYASEVEGTVLGYISLWHRTRKCTAVLHHHQENLDNVDTAPKIRNEELVYARVSHYDSQRLWREQTGSVPPIHAPQTALQYTDDEPTASQQAVDEALAGAALDLDSGEFAGGGQTLFATSDLQDSFIFSVRGGARCGLYLAAVFPVHAGPLQAGPAATAGPVTRASSD